VWKWSSAPVRHLDTALRLKMASNSNVRLVDAGSAPALAANPTGVGILSLRGRRAWQGPLGGSHQLISLRFWQG
jgi:hypothetical protein